MWLPQFSGLQTSCMFFLKCSVTICEWALNWPLFLFEKRFFPKAHHSIPSPPIRSSSTLFRGALTRPSVGWARCCASWRCSGSTRRSWRGATSRCWSRRSTCAGRTAGWRRRAARCRWRSRRGLVTSPGTRYVKETNTNYSNTVLTSRTLWGRRQKSTADPPLWRSLRAFRVLGHSTRKPRTTLDDFSGGVGLC